MLKNIYRLITDRKISTLASAISFYIIINGGSFLFLYFLLSGFLANNFNVLFLSQIGDSAVADLLKYFFDYQNGIPYSFFLVLTSIYSASSLYYHLIEVTELLTRIPYKLSISQRLLAIVLTLIYLFSLNLVTLLATKIILLFNVYLHCLVGFLVLLIFTFSVYVINVVALRDYHIKRLYRGIILTVIYSLLFTVGFILYLSFFSNFKIVYGILSFLIILFFYIYVLAIGILLGVYWNFKNIKIAKLVKNSNS